MRVTLEHDEVVQAVQEYLERRVRGRIEVTEVKSSSSDGDQVELSARYQEVELPEEPATVGQEGEDDSFAPSSVSDDEDDWRDPPEVRAVEGGGGNVSTRRGRVSRQTRMAITGEASAPAEEVG